MRTLDRKLLRDVRRNWMQVISIALVMACATMTIMGLRGTLVSVQRSRDAYYDAYRFADVFATVRRAPASLQRVLAALPGVGSLEARISSAVRLDVPGLREPATGQIVSIPASPRPMLNALHLRRGRWIAPGRDDEVLVSERFAELNHLVPGDTLAAVLNGRWQRLRIVGIALSPEFVVEAGAAGEFVDARRFGVLWASRRTLETAFDMKGAFNDVCVRLAPGASEPAVIAALDRVLAPYGSAGAYGRRDQPAARILANEFTQLRTTSTVFPSFFLVVGAFLLNVVLSRLVASQRDEIAALKAFGYTDREVGIHYLLFALCAVALGAAIGLPAGQWMGHRFTAMYAAYFRFPALRSIMDWRGAALAIGVSGGFALLGALGALRRVMALPPAEALRPESPARFRPLLIERAGLGRFASPTVRMVLRNLERRPVRTASSVLGVALAVALLAAGRFPYDAFDRLLDVQFRLANRADVTVQFTRARPARAALELRQLPGVAAVEPFRAVPVRVSHGAASRTTALVGVPRHAMLRRLVDVDGRSHEPPAGGAALTSRLARVLGVRTGDTVGVVLLDRGGPPRPLVVVALLDEMLGYAVYMDAAALGRYLRESGTVDGAYLSVRPGAAAGVFTALERLPGVLVASSREATIQNIEEQMSESMSFVLWLITISACVIATGVVYNSARIALSERGRELASLRVLGFTRGEVAAILLGEQAAVVLLALPVGALFGLGFSALLVTGFATEHFNFPFVAKLDSYVLAGAVVVLAAALTGVFVRRRVGRLDLVGVLKTRE